MIVCSLDLADYLAIVTEVTGLDVETAIRVTNMDLADSALHAPQAGWGETDLDPDFVDKAAVLVARLTKNHPLPDGNMRAAWVALRVFMELNEWEWAPDPPVDEAERLMLDVAGGTWSEQEAAAWLTRRIRPLPEVGRRATGRRHGSCRSMAPGDGRGHPGCRPLSPDGRLHPPRTTRRRTRRGGRDGGAPPVQPVTEEDC